MDPIGFLHLPVAVLFGYAIPFIVALTLIVFVHEYGHFKVARLCGVKVEIFSIGFGRELWGMTDRYGTRWKIGWLPLGGYVKFAGDANVASLAEAPSSDRPPDPDEFHGKAVWQRALVVVAGPAANFVLAILIFAAAVSFFGVPVSQPRVDEVLPGSAAEKAGIQPGDIIKSIGGTAIDTFQDVQQIVMTRSGETLVLGIERKGARVAITVVPEVKEESDGFGGTVRVGQLGIKNTEGKLVYQKKSFPEALQYGVGHTWFVVETTLRYVGKLFVGQESTRQLGGVISIAKAAGDAASAGVTQFIFLIGFLSVSIGLINLFPIPMLDGGHLVYYAIEAVRGKPLGPEAQEWGFKIGFTVVLALMLVANWNDLVRLVASAQ